PPRGAWRGAGRPTPPPVRPAGRSRSARRGGGARPSAPDRLAKQRIEPRPEADALGLPAVDVEGRRARRVVGLVRPLRILGRAQDSGAVGQALVDLLLGHAALAEEGVDAGLTDQSRRLLLIA